ncbi:hypothetical protein EDC04DRAFT_2844528 [Pisolithus marmoratus]|nr:hypothetical protein EDC04DRAFT_2844528 [Pisolithus marmoratus]
MCRIPVVPHSKTSLTGSPFIIGWRHFASKSFPSLLPFIMKSPFHVAHVLQEHMCQTPHSIDDYPDYYDPLYFPHLHLMLFDNSQNFCNWLASALNSQHLTCCCCPAYSNVWIFKPKLSAPPQSKDAMGSHIYQLDMKKLKLLLYYMQITSKLIW